MAKSERITEDIVRNHFKNDSLFDVIKLDEQKTTVSKAMKCLSTASKKLTHKSGFPEFIISFPDLPDDIIVVECKADTKFHESSERTKPSEYAVDGVLHYARFLSHEYNVIAIAVSGTEEGKIKVSSYYQEKNSKSTSPVASELLSIYSYIEKLKGVTYAKGIEVTEITKTAIELNSELNDYSIVEYERCTLISAILLALRHSAFKASYKEHAVSSARKPTPTRLVKQILESIKSVLKDANIDDDRTNIMLKEFERISNHEISIATMIKKKNATGESKNYVLRDIAELLETKILPLMTLGDKGYDVLGRFYREFIRYAGTDKKTGLVLTPQHITEFFCEVVSLNVNDVVFDSCCGSGGFLISAMKRMLDTAGSNQERREEIKRKQIVGVEKMPSMFTYSCANMIMSGDGKSNIYQGDSFTLRIQKIVSELNPTVAFLNPPYDVGEGGQLDFVENALSCLQPNGRCAAIVQMCCVTSDKKLTVNARKRLLDSHTLTGVFSMPNDLFYPVGVVTCILVFDAHRPHPKNYKTFFGYYKDDGHEKSKHRGRVDYGKWNSIKEEWLKVFLNRQHKNRLSVLEEVTAEKEWCAEAYMETDYSTLTDVKFAETVKKFVAFQFLQGGENESRTSV